MEHEIFCMHTDIVMRNVDLFSMSLLYNILCFIYYSVLYYIYSFPHMSSERPNGKRILMDTLNIISPMQTTY
jgi:hypothetical protein